MEHYFVFTVLDYAWSAVHQKKGMTNMKIKMPKIALVVLSGMALWAANIQVAHAEWLNGDITINVTGSGTYVKLPTPPGLPPMFGWTLVPLAGVYVTMAPIEADKAYVRLLPKTLPTNENGQVMFDKYLFQSGRPLIQATFTATYQGKTVSVTSGIVGSGIGTSIQFLP